LLFGSCRLASAPAPHGVAQCAQRSAQARAGTVELGAHSFNSMAESASAVSVVF